MILDQGGILGIKSFIKIQNILIYHQRKNLLVLFKEREGKRVKLQLNSV